MRVSQNFTGVGVGVRESQENSKLTPSFQPATKVATFRCESVPGRVDWSFFLSAERKRAAKRVITCYAIYKHIRARVTLRV